MSNALRTPEDYELFLYTITEQFPSVLRSTAVLVRRGSTLARVSGALHFANGFRLVLRERLVYHHLSAVICQAPDDNIPRRSWPLFRARKRISEILSEYEQPGLSP